MEFDKSKVYTALNADELKIGSKVICANNLDSLRRKVNEDSDITEVREIVDESNERRFRTEFSGLWPLAYLVSEPELNWIAYLCRVKNHESFLTACRSDVWERAQKNYGAKTKLFEGTEEEVDDWYTARRQFADVIAAWEDGKIIQYNSGYGWEDCCDNKPAWDVKSQYRIKPEGLKWTDLKIGDIVQNENLTRSMMVIGIDYKEGAISHIFTGAEWLTEEDLKDWEKVE